MTTFPVFPDPLQLLHVIVPLPLHVGHRFFAIEPLPIQYAARVAALASTRNTLLSMLSQTTGLVDDHK